MPRDNQILGYRPLGAVASFAARIEGSSVASATWGELATGCLSINNSAAYRGRSVLIAAGAQYTAAAALLQLDGNARRMTLYPPDLSRELLSYVARLTHADVILTDDPSLESADAEVQLFDPLTQVPRLGDDRERESIETEWILLTSGTTGPPKLVTHNLSTLSAAIASQKQPATAPTWSTFYDIRRYGGLQIFLRAALHGATLVLQDQHESTAEFLTRAGAWGVTHISGTPSHWRRALMSGAADRIAPVNVRLSGEIADQSILDELRSQYPHARIAHAFASTEAGVAFEVSDGLMGFPAEMLTSSSQVEMKVEEGTLRIRSQGMTSGYLNDPSLQLRDGYGYIDTGDVIELRNGRYHFAGRRDGTINVGGAKVHPEEVEAVINQHCNVAGSLVKAKKNPITGALVVADVVLKAVNESAVEDGSAEKEILELCRGALSAYKVPIAIRFVTSLPMSNNGKLVRAHA